MKYKPILNLCLLSVFLLMVPVSCDDWTEMEIHDSEINGFKEQNPEQYAAYTQKLRAYKAAKHALVYARLDNAPEVSSSEKDFLRALPDSIDLVSMRNAGRFSGFDREDMKLVRTDYGTRVLYYIDASAAEGLNAALSAAIDAVRAGTFDGVTLASASSVDESVVKTLADALGQTDCLLIFEGTPLLVSEAQRSVFDYYIVDVSAAADDYDLEMAINHALNWGVSAERLMLGSVHGRTVTDNDKTVHSSLPFFYVRLCGTMEQNHSQNRRTIMLKDSQVDLCGRTDFTRTAPLLARDEAFSFACAGCGGCCRGREDIVLSGFDLWRIAARLRLPPRTVARAFCRGSIGRVSRLPVLRLAPLKEERGNCPFLTGNHCAIHDAEPLVCALYPLAQEITKEGQVSYFLQPTQCGGQVIAARVGDYLARYDVPAREATDVRWAQVCMALEDTVERLDALFEPVFARRMQEKLWQALYYRYDFAKEYRPQLEENLLWLDGELKKLEGMQMRHRTIEKSDR